MRTRLRIQAMVAATALAFILSGSLPAMSQTATPSFAHADRGSARGARSVDRGARKTQARQRPRRGPAAAPAMSTCCADCSTSSRSAWTISRPSCRRAAFPRPSTTTPIGKGSPTTSPRNTRPASTARSILIGHSLGADAVMIQAEYLGKKGVPVALVVPFDGTGSYAASQQRRARDEPDAARLRLHEARHRLPRRIAEYRREQGSLDRSHQHRQVRPAAQHGRGQASSACSVAAAVRRSRSRRLGTRPRARDRHRARRGRHGGGRGPVGGAAAPKAQ